MHKSEVTRKVTGLIFLAAIAWCKRCTSQKAWGQRRELLSRSRNVEAISSEKLILEDGLHDTHLKASRVWVSALGKQQKWGNGNRGIPADDFLAASAASFSSTVWPCSGLSSFCFSRPAIRAALMGSLKICPNRLYTPPRGMCGFWGPVCSKEIHLPAFCKCRLCTKCATSSC